MSPGLLGPPSKPTRRPQEILTFTCLKLILIYPSSANISLLDEERPSRFPTPILKMPMSPTKQKSKEEALGTVIASSLTLSSFLIPS